ncbi:MAG: hypothetical protein QM703_22640 [Gemmatales bacterium]
MANEITIKIGGHDGFVGVGALIEALENALKALRSLENTNRPPHAIRWEIIRASMRSPLSLTLAAKSVEPKYMKSAERSGSRILKDFRKGMRAISKTPEMPKNFDEETLSAVKALGELSNRESMSLAIYSPDEDPIIPSPELIENVKQAVAKTKTLYEHGVIEGQLEVVSTHGCDSFYVWESLTGNKVECFPSSPEQFATVPKYLRKRVSVTGRIKCKTDKPVSVQVEEVSALRDQSELPQLKDMGKIDITGGLSSDDYVQRLRDGKF